MPRRNPGPAAMALAALMLASPALARPHLMGRLDARDGLKGYTLGTRPPAGFREQAMGGGDTFVHVGRKKFQGVPVDLRLEYHRHKLAAICMDAVDPASAKALHARLVRDCGAGRAGKLFKDLGMRVWTGKRVQLDWRESPRSGGAEATVRPKGI